MKTAILITLILVASMVYAIVWYPTSIQIKWVFGILLLFLAFCWSARGIHEIKFRKWYKQSLRFNWYNKVGLLESACILEPERATKYWKNIMGGIFK